MVLICFMVFYRGYRSVAWDNTMFKQYLGCEIALTLFFCFNFKYETSSYNGLDRMLNLWRAGNTKTVFFVIFEQAFLGLSIFMRLSCMYVALNWRVKDTY